MASISETLSSALAHHQAGRLAEAIACYRQALQWEPGLATAWYNLGNALREQGQLEPASAAYGQALRLEPDFAEAYHNLGTTRRDQGRLEEAAACYARALELRPDDAVAHSNLLFYEQYRPGVTLARLALLHAEWNRRHAQPLSSATRPWTSGGDPQRALRLGFVSGDFGCHPVSYFLVGALESLRGENCHTYCYCDRLRSDPLTLRLQAAAGDWRDVRGLAHEALAAQIRGDAIDVLFDLAGHTGNRLLTFARRPAPIQISWIGQEGTTGLAAMDYILADRHLIPPAHEPYYCERVLRMPDGYVCYDPPADAPAVSALPALEAGAVTFGCFNNPAKITAEVIEAWSAILRRLRGARLRLKFQGLDQPWAQRRFREGFAAQAVDAARIDFCGWSSRPESLAEYQRIDVALDPFPFSGGATSCDALWMGVPVVTIAGATFAGRHSLSHLSNVGLTETIAADRQQYVELAVGLAQDRPRLAAIRARLRDQMAASPLCDAPRFAGNLLRVLRGVWQEFACKQRG